MKQAGFVFTAMAAIFLFACSPNPTSSDVTQTPVALTADTLIGTWDVSLYFAPDTPPSVTVLDITSVAEDGRLGGSFYQSPFERGRYEIRDNEIIISVVTSDGSGRYQTSGRLSAAGEFKGQTHSIGREFLMPWTAKRR